MELSFQLLPVVCLGANDYFIQEKVTIEGITPFFLFLFLWCPIHSTIDAIHAMSQNSRSFEKLKSFVCRRKREHTEVVAIICDVSGSCLKNSELVLLYLSCFMADWTSALCTHLSHYSNLLFNSRTQFQFPAMLTTLNQSNNQSINQYSHCEQYLSTSSVQPVEFLFLCVPLTRMPLSEIFTCTSLWQCFQLRVANISITVG